MYKLGLHVYIMTLHIKVGTAHSKVDPIFIVSKNKGFAHLYCKMYCLLERKWIGLNKSIDLLKVVLIAVI